MKTLFRYIASIVTAWILGVILYVVLIPDPCLYHLPGGKTPGFWIMTFLSDGDTVPAPFHPEPNALYCICFSALGISAAYLLGKVMKNRPISG